MKNSKLFVGNLSSKVERKDIEELFEKYGRLKDITLKEKRENYAFIEFDDPRDAEEALEKENGQEFFGKRLRIEFSHGGKTGKSEKFDSNNIKNSSCFICMKKGHWARECPKNEGRSIVMGKCFKCGSSRHKIQDCPKNSRSRSRSRSKSSRGRSSSYGSRRHRRNESRSQSKSYSRDRARRPEEKRKSRSGSRRRENREVRDGRDTRDMRDTRDLRDGRDNRDQKRGGGPVDRRRRSDSGS